jgi:hypothetical protein
MSIRVSDLNNFDKDYDPMYMFHDQYFNRDQTLFKSIYDLGDCISSGSDWSPRQKEDAKTSIEPEQSPLRAEIQKSLSDLIQAISAIKFSEQSARYWRGDVSYTLESVEPVQTSLRQLDESSDNFLKSVNKIQALIAFGTGLCFLGSLQGSFGSAFLGAVGAVGVLALYELRQIGSTFIEVTEGLRQDLQNKIGTVLERGGATQIDGQELVLVYLRNFSTLLERRLCLLNYPLLYRKQIQQLPQMAMPETSDKRGGDKRSVGKCVESLLWIVSDVSEGDREWIDTKIILNIFREINRPVAFVRSTALISAVVLYGASSFLPLPLLFKISSLVMGAFAFEAHQIYQAIDKTVIDEGCYGELFGPSFEMWREEQVRDKIKRIIEEVRIKAGIFSFFFSKKIEFLSQQIEPEQSLTDDSDEEAFEESSIDEMRSSIKSRIDQMVNKIPQGLRDIEVDCDPLQHIHHLGRVQWLRRSSEFSRGFDE